MIKKKSLKTVISILLIMILSFTTFGCSKGNDGGENTAAETVNQLIMGTGGVSGTWYPVGGVICGAISKSSIINATAQTAAGGVESIRLVDAGERQLGFAMPSLAIYAKKGIEAFEGTPVDSIRAICAFMPMEAHFIVRSDSGINSLADLKGKAIGTGAPGSGDEVMCREILDAVGITYDDCKPMKLSFSEQVTAFKDRQLDAMFMLASSPTSSVLDASSQADVKLLPIEGDLRDQILEKYPYYSPTAIPDANYNFIDNDVETIGIPTMMFTSADIEDDVVYEICKFMFDGIETIQAAHPSMKSFILETAIDGLAVELHPGAQKYYEDNGVL